MSWRSEGRPLLCSGIVIAKRKSIKIICLTILMPVKAILISIFCCVAFTHIESVSSLTPDVNYPGTEDLVNNFDFFWGWSACWFSTYELALLWPPGYYCYHSRNGFSFFYLKWKYIKSYSICNYSNAGIRGMRSRAHCKRVYPGKHCHHSYFCCQAVIWAVLHCGFKG